MQVKQWFLLCLILLLFSTYTRGQVQQKTIVVSPLIGDTLDVVERDNYRLFPAIAGFRWAVFYSNAKNKSLTVRVVFLQNGVEKDTIIQQYRTLADLQYHIEQINKIKVDQLRKVKPVKNIPAQASDNSIHFGLCGEFNFGYHSIGSNDLSKGDLGDVGQTGLVKLASIGIVAYRYQKFQISCVYSGCGAGTKDSDDGYGFKWHNAFRSGDDVPMGLSTTDLRLEFQLLNSIIDDYIFPFIGIGKTLSYSLVDDGGSGFIDGGGNYHFSTGIDLDLGGIISQESSQEGRSFSTLRIGLIYRPSFAFKEFIIGGKTVPVEFKGNSFTIYFGYHLIVGLL